MRCGCPRCGTDSYMIHSERDNCCVCPECLYRCYACQGDGQALSREAFLALKNITPGEQALFLRQYAADDASDQVVEPGMRSVRIRDRKEEPTRDDPFHARRNREEWGD